MSKQRMMLLHLNLRRSEAKRTPTRAMATTQSKSQTKSRFNEAAF